MAETSTLAPSVMPTDERVWTFKTLADAAGTNYYFTRLAWLKKELDTFLVDGCTTHFIRDSEARRWAKTEGVELP